MTTTTLTLDALAAVKEKQQATWASGDYAVIGTDTNNDFHGGDRYGNRGAGKVLDHLRQRK